MKRQIEGVAEQLLDCAAKEFLDKGFADASLREDRKAMWRQYTLHLHPFSG